jgi:hypothetical protein
VNRRDTIKLAALGVGLVAMPGFALAAQPTAPLIFDGRFATGIAFAAGNPRTWDCGEDAASLWFAQFAHKPLPSGGIAGFTTMADALVLADCARRQRLRLVLADIPADPSGLVHWHITA